ncbi:MAG: hypothetical protein KAG19_01750 [Methylococcales bacterium]|nr:hypothetical protein [Methylococcales bacterium]
MFETVILIGAICGSIMVLGSMFLLYKGAISLRAAADHEAISIELIDEIKMSTRYPALALFLIGFVFFISAAWFAQSAETKFLVEGNVSSPDKLIDVELHLSAGTWKQSVLDERGTFSVLFYPNMDRLIATVIAPGYENSGVTRDVRVKQNRVIIGTLEIGKRIIDDIQPQGMIIPRQTMENGQSPSATESF